MTILSSFITRFADGIRFISRQLTAVVGKLKGKNCHEIFRSLSQQMKNMFSPESFPNGYYRTITHETVVKRLALLGKNGFVSILTCKPVYSKDLAVTQKNILQRSCKRCGRGIHCLFRRIALRDKQFYYIEFQVHIHTPCGRP